LLVAALDGQIWLAPQPGSGGEIEEFVDERTSPVTPASNRMHWRFRIIRITSKPLMVA
jgi:hypothetical protein